MADPFDKSTILGCFVAEARSYLPRIRTNVEGFAADPKQERLREEGHRLAHAVRSASVMMGYADLGKVVQPIEVFLDSVSGRKDRLGREVVGTICRSLDRAAIILDGMQGEWIDGERIMQENESDFKDLQETLSCLGVLTQPEGWVPQCGDGERPRTETGDGPLSATITPESADAPDAAGMPAEEQGLGAADEATGLATAMSWEQIEGILAETTADDESLTVEEAESCPSPVESPAETADLCDAVLGLLPMPPQESEADSIAADPGYLALSLDQRPSARESELSVASAMQSADSPPDVIPGDALVASASSPAVSSFANALSHLEEGRVLLESFFGKLQGLLAEADLAIGDLLALKPAGVNMSLIANRRYAQAFSAAENLAGPLAEIAAEMDGLSPVSLAMENVQTILEQAADELTEASKNAVVEPAEQDSEVKALESPTELRSAIEDEVRQAVLKEIAAEKELAAQEKDRRRQEYEKELHARLTAEIREDLTAQFARAARVPMRRAAMKCPGVATVDTSGIEDNLAANLPQELLDTFRLEAEEHLLAIGRDLLALEKSPSNGDALRDLRRSVHTLKGAAASMGFRVTGEMAHTLEDLLDAIDEGHLEVSPPIQGLILDTSFALETLVASALASRREDRGILAALEPRYRELLSSLDAGGLELSAPIPVGVTQADGELSQTAKVAAPQVHVAVAQVDEAMNSVGEMVTNRALLAEQIANLKQALGELALGTRRLDRLSHGLDSMQGAGVGGEGVDGGSLASGQPRVPRPPTPNSHDRSEFDELELDRYTAFDLLTQEMTEAVSDVGTVGSEMETLAAQLETVADRQNRLNMELQDRLRRLRLVPLSGLAPRLHRAVRNTALALGKEVEFVFLGGDVEVDRTVFENIGDPLLHLMRNAVDHGIETPAERLAAGKAEKGRVTLEADREGGELVIRVGDDGRGISWPVVYERALARGLIGQGDRLSDSQLEGLLFVPGFSTAPAVSETSGRGMGLDIVQAAFSQMRGTVQVGSTVGEGAAFTIRLPLALAIDRALLVKVSTETFAVPLGQIERVLRLDKQDLGCGGPDDLLDLSGQTYPIVRLGQALGLPASVGTEARTAPILIAGPANRRVAVVVDEIVGQQEIVAKALGSQYRSLAGFSGATILGNGQVVVILDIGGFSASGVPWAPREAASPPPGGSEPLSILVVDDSPSVRRIVSNILQKSGFEPQVARDGVEALEMVQDRPPNAILLDVEMPRMDGYELLSILKSQQKYERIPVVMLTSRSGSKHRQKALQLGANGYLVKPYKDEDLISLLKDLAVARV